MAFGEVTGKEMQQDREYSITDKFICNAVEFDSNNLPCT